MSNPIIQTSIHGNRFGMNEKNDLIVQNATTGKDEIAVPAPGALIVNVTASSITLDPALHKNRIVTLNRAAGVAVTLPAATGSGDKYRLVVGTTVTSSATTIKAANASDAFQGVSMIVSDDTAAVKGFIASPGSDDTVTWNGTTTGGYVGDEAELIDIGANRWQVNILGKATGTENTPFSATVS